MKRTWRVGATWPYIESTLLHADGTPMILTDATVAFTMRRLAAAGTGAVKVNGQPGTVVGPTAGEVRYAQSAADMDTPGLYHGQWKVTETSGLISYWPVNEVFEIEIIEREDS